MWLSFAQVSLPSTREEAPVVHHSIALSKPENRQNSNDLGQMGGGLGDGAEGQRNAKGSRESVGPGRVRCPPGFTSVQKGHEYSRRGHDDGGHGRRGHDDGGHGRRGRDDGGHGRRGHDDGGHGRRGHDDGGHGSGHGRRGHDGEGGVMMMVDMEAGVMVTENMAVDILTKTIFVMMQEVGDSTLQTLPNRKLEGWNVTPRN